MCGRTHDWGGVGTVAVVAHVATQGLSWKSTMIWFKKIMLTSLLTTAVIPACVLLIRHYLLLILIERLFEGVQPWIQNLSAQGETVVIAYLHGEEHRWETQSAAASWFDVLEQKPDQLYLVAFRQGYGKVTGEGRHAGLRWHYHVHLLRTLSESIGWIKTLVSCGTS